MQIQKTSKMLRVNIRPDSVTPEEVEQLIGEKVIITFRSNGKANNHKVGEIVAHENTAKETGGKESKWKFVVHIKDDAFEDDAFEDYVSEDDVSEDDVSKDGALEDDGSPRKEYLHYDEACWSMNRFNEYMESELDESPSDWSRANPHFIRCFQCDEKPAQSTCKNGMCGSCCLGTMATIPCDLKSHNRPPPTSSGVNRPSPHEQCIHCDKKAAQKSCPHNMCRSCCLGRMAAPPCELKSHNRAQETTTPSSGVNAVEVDNDDVSEPGIIEHSVEEASFDYSLMTCKELKAVLKSKNLTCSGNKADLLARLGTSSS